MRSLIVLLVSAFVISCGSPPPRSALDSEPSLDWARLLPIETDGLVRVDLQRMRRSPHRASVQPVFDDFLGGLAFESARDPAMRRAFDGLLARTDVVMIAMLPPALGTDDEILILARGRYAADELARLQVGRSMQVDGHRVWVEGEDRDATAVTALRADTIAMTATLGRMERLIARTRMPPTSPRWPPALRALITASGLEEATIGLALADRGIGEGGDLMTISMAGTANVDGPLDLSLVMELGDPTLAAAATMFFEGLVAELSRSAVGEAFALAELAELTQFEANGTRVVGSIHAPPRSAEQLVPGLMGLLRDGIEEGPPAIASPLPTPI